MIGRQPVLLGVGQAVTDLFPGLCCRRVAVSIGHDESFDRWHGVSLARHSPAPGRVERQRRPSEYRARTARRRSMALTAAAVGSRARQGCPTSAVHAPASGIWYRRASGITERRWQSFGRSHGSEAGHRSADRAATSDGHVPTCTVRGPVPNTDYVRSRKQTPDVCSWPSRSAHRGATSGPSPAISDSDGSRHAMVLKPAFGGTPPLCARRAIWGTRSGP